MNDKEIEKIQTIDISVTAESLDAHIMCLRQNGYSISFLLGAFIVGTILK